ncbi:hypothetical protein MJM43_29915, partial [Salmonella enterica subsp. enterica serovar Montevideo]|nr:hypothetical protein [Salmonella enterica subsp. enterica serovar Montevideo]
KIYFSGKSMIKLGQAYNVIRLGKLIPSCSGHNQQNTGVYKSAEIAMVIMPAADGVQFRVSIKGR